MARSIIGRATPRRTRQKPRRTQEQRSAEMRIRLLDATVDCLVQYGYSGTTTPRVAARAGVTRGAQVHHFGSKNDLVTAAIKHLAERRVQSAMNDIDELDIGADATSVVLDFLWDVHQGPLYTATVELWIAGRTDPALAAEMAKVEPFVNSALLAAIAQLVPSEMQRKEIRDFVYTAMDALRGILVSSFVDGDPSRARRRWDRATANLRRIADESLPDIRRAMAGELTGEAG